MDSTTGEFREMKLKSKTLMVVFGSGGHTTEMLKMLSTDKN